MLEKTTLMLWACARSLMLARFAWISSLVIGPVLPAISLVPARMTTAFGCKSMTSRRKRISICAYVCCWVQVVGGGPEPNRHRGWPRAADPPIDVGLARKDPAISRLLPSIGD